MIKYEISTELDKHLQNLVKILEILENNFKFFLLNFL